MGRCLSCGTLEIKVYLNEMHGLDVVIADLCYPRTKKYARELRRLPLLQSNLWFRKRRATCSKVKVHTVVYCCDGVNG